MSPAGRYTSADLERRADIEQQFQVIRAQETLRASKRHNRLRTGVTKVTVEPTS